VTSGNKLNSSSKAKSSAVLAGVIAGAVVLCVFVVFLLALYIRRRPRSSLSEEEKLQSPHQVLALLPSRATQAEIKGKLLIWKVLQ
jgi:hypothetical protein